VRKEKTFAEPNGTVGFATHQKFPTLVSSIIISYLLFKKLLIKISNLIKELVAINSKFVNYFV
jgi:hypothetical protein